LDKVTKQAADLAEYIMLLDQKLFIYYRAPLKIQSFKQNEARTTNVGAAYD
jgi:hypothetical protein